MACERTKFILRVVKKLKRKRLDRDIWWEYNKVKFPRYYQMRVENEEFHGLVCLLQLIDGEPYYWNHPDGRKRAVIGKGMTWLQLIPDGQNHVLTAKYLPDESVSVWYTDVIEKIEYDFDGVAVFIDKYLDVAFSPQGEVIVDDRDELDEALESGELSKEQYDVALRECDMIVQEYCSSIEKIRETEIICGKILSHVNDRIKRGERQFNSKTNQFPS